MTPHPRDQAILAERARRLADAPLGQPAAQTGASLEVAAFHRGGEYWGLPTSGVREIQPLRAHRWARVPCAPAFVVGLLNLRGRLYSLIDLAAFWGQPAQPPAEQAHLLLVYGQTELELALLTDDLPTVLNLPLDALAPAPAHVSAQALEHLRGVTAEALAVLDLQRLLADPRLIVFEEP